MTQTTNVLLAATSWYHYKSVHIWFHLILFELNWTGQDYWRRHLLGHWGTCPPPLLRFPTVYFFLFAFELHSLTAILCRSVQTILQSMTSAAVVYWWLHENISGHICATNNFHLGRVLCLVHPVTPNTGDATGQCPLSTVQSSWDEMIDVNTL